MSTSDDQQWYAVRTRSHFEKVVRQQLAGRGIEPFLPVRRRVSQWKDRKKEIEWPLFPCYCFARFNADQRPTVVQTIGIIEIIGSAGRPEPIDEEEIKGLQRIATGPQPYDALPYLDLGTPVEVLRGPFQGIRGKLIRTARHCRLVVGITLIQQAAVIEIDAADVGPVVTESVKACIT